MGTIVDYATFIWDIIKNLIGTLKNIIEFIFNLPNFISQFLSFLPSEITIPLLAVLTILIIISVFKFVK